MVYHTATANYILKKLNGRSIHEFAFINYFATAVNYSCKVSLTFTCVDKIFGVSSRAGDNHSIILGDTFTKPPKNDFYNFFV
jgi:hypothetical protein